MTEGSIEHSEENEYQECAKKLLSDLKDNKGKSYADIGIGTIVFYDQKPEPPAQALEIEDQKVQDALSEILQKYKQPIGSVSDLRPHLKNLPIKFV